MTDPTIALKQCLINIGLEKDSDFLREAVQLLRRKDIEHIRSAPYHPMTQGKFERCHRSMKNVVKLQNYYYPSELEKAIAQFIR